MQEAVLLLIAIGLVTYDSAISVHHINHFALKPVRSSLHLDALGFLPKLFEIPFMCMAYNSRSLVTSSKSSEAVESRLRRPSWDSLL